MSSIQLTAYRFRLAALQLKRLRSKRLLLAFDIESVLSPLPRVPQEDIHEDHLPLAMKVLRWLTVSYRPLSIMEISEACTIPPEDELRGATTLNQDHGLTHEQLMNLPPKFVVPIQADWSPGEGLGHSKLAFAHFSVQEYLIGSQLLESPSANFRIQLRDAHCLVATECLAYLFISRSVGSQGCLVEYAREHWQLHAVATGDLDEETRRNAFLLSASILSGDPPTDERELPKDFVHVTRWLGDPQDIRELISSLRAWSHLANGGKMMLAILYSQDGNSSTLRFRRWHIRHEKSA